jgi:hypothetical protein
MIDAPLASRRQDWNAGKYVTSKSLPETIALLHEIHIIRFRAPDTMLTNASGLPTGSVPENMLPSVCSRRQCSAVSQGWQRLPEPGHPKLLTRHTGRSETGPRLAPLALDPSVDRGRCCCNAVLRRLYACRIVYAASSHVGRVECKAAVWVGIVGAAVHGILCPSLDTQHLRVHLTQ